MVKAVKGLDLGQEGRDDVYFGGMKDERIENLLQESEDGERKLEGDCGVWFNDRNHGA